MNRPGMQFAIVTGLAVVVGLIAVGTNAAELYLICGVSIGLCILICVRWGTRDVFSPMIYLGVLLAYYVFGVVNPFHLDINHLGLAPGVYLSVMYVVFAGVLAYCVGAWAGSVLSISPRARGATIECTGLLRAAILSLGVGVLFSVPHYLSSGIPITGADPGEARRFFTAGLSPWAFAQWTFLEVAFVLGLYVFSVTDKRRRWAGLVTAIAGLVVLAGLGSRVMIGTPLIIAACTYHYGARRLRGCQAAWLGAVSLCLISVLWIWRKREYLFHQGGGLAMSDEWGGSSTLSIMQMVFAGLAVFARTSIEAFAYLVTLGGGTFRGEISLMSFYAMAPGKQDGYGLYHMTRLLGGDPSVSGGSTVSLVGGLYGDFGIVGVLLGMMCLGAALKILNRIAISSGSLEVIILYAVCVSYYLNMIYGGQFIDTSLVYRLLVFEAVLGIALLTDRNKLPPRMVVACATVPLILLYALYRMFIGGR